MKCVVTGAAGFIGSHVVDRLLEQGHEVVGVDNFDDFYDPAIKWNNLKGALEHSSFRLVEADIRDQDAMDDAFAGADTVLHFAAKAGVRPSIEDPRGYQDVNVGGTVSVLEACRHNGVKNVIFASSSSVYGNNQKTPFTESDPVDHPISPYAASKKAAELMCHTWHALWGLDITCLRYFTVYGPRQRPDLAIHKFARLGMQGKAVPFFGDGSMARDYTYFGDIVDGTMAALNTNSGAGYRIINLGSDLPIRLDSLVDAIGKAVGVEIEKDVMPAPAGDVDITWADLSMAKKELGYTPRMPLDEGLKRFVSWLMNRKA
jgi:UDP-glucuronate 4-epimerase